MPAGWKDKVNNVPLLGRLLAVLRGVYTLPVWRQALRHDIEAVRHDLQHVRDALSRQDLLASKEALRDLESGLAERFEASQVQHRELRLELLSALRSQLADLEYRVSVLQAAAGFPGGAALEMAVAPAVVQPLLSAALLPEAEAALLASLDSLGLSGLGGFATSPEWAAEASAAPQTRPHAWCAHGWAHLAPDQQQRQLQQVRAALQPGGWFALCCPNPENLLTLARGARLGWPGLLWPAQAEALMLAAGFVSASVHRFGRSWPDDNSTPCRPEEDRHAALSLALAQPQYFWLVGQVQRATA